MKNNRILFITPGYYPVTNERGGAIEDLVNLFLQYNDRNQKYTITVYSAFSNAANRDEDIYNNTCFRSIKIDSFIYKVMTKMHAISRRISRTTYQRRYAHLVIKDLARKKELSDYYSVVVIDNSIKELLYYRKKIGKSSRLILHLHNDILFPEVNMAKRILDSVDKVWCCSNFIADRVNSISANNKKTRVLYNTTKLYDSITKIKKEKNQKKEFVIFYLGRIMREKGVLELVEAYNLFHEQHPESRLILAGGAKNIYKADNYYNRISELAKNRNDISIKNNIKHSELLRLYKTIDVQIVPSIWNEAFGITALEGALSGTPVIFSDRGGLPEIFSDHKLMLNKISKESIFEKIDEVYNNRHRLKQFVDKERNNAQRFSAKRYCSCFDKYIMEVIKDEK